MKAFHNDSKVKLFYLDRLCLHEKRDEIVQGKYWENGKGCAVGCTLHSDQHASYETELGIPKILARLEDRIFEGLPLALAKPWPSRFLRSIKIGADLSSVWYKFASRLLTDPIGGVIQYAKNEEQLEVIQRVSDLYEAKIIGLEVDPEDFKDAYAAAAAAAAYAAAYAAYAAADAAADAADAAAAAAYAAYAAADAAAAAAYAAADAADAAAGRERAYIWQSELLLELLKEAK